MTSISITVNTDSILDFMKRIVFFGSVLAMVSSNTGGRRLNDILAAFEERSSSIVVKIFVGYWANKATKFIIQFILEIRNNKLDEGHFMSNMLELLTFTW